MTTCFHLYKILIFKNDAKENPLYGLIHKTGSKNLYKRLYITIASELQDFSKELLFHRHHVSEEQFFPELYQFYHR